MLVLTEKGREYKEELMDDLFYGYERPGRFRMRILQAFDDIDRTGLTDFRDILKSLWYYRYVDKVDK